MTGFIIKYVVLLINQKDYEHYLSRLDKLPVLKPGSKYIDAWVNGMKIRHGPHQNSFFCSEKRGVERICRLTS